MTVGLLSFTGTQLFNGGKSQGQSEDAAANADYPFVNLFNGASIWQGTDTFNNNAAIDPTWLGVDGWPLASALQTFNVSGNGVFLGVPIPPQTSYTGTGNGNLHLFCTVTSAGPTDTVQLAINLIGQTPVSGSLTSTAGFNGTFEYVFTPQYLNSGANINIKKLNGTAHVTAMALVFNGQDRTDYLAGKFFGQSYTSRLAQLGFGVFRFMDWLQTNAGNITTWATRKSLNYATWAGDEYRANLSAGVTSGNSGNNYMITIPGSYAWPGYTGGAPVDKQTMHLRFNADAAFVFNKVGSGLTVTSASPLTFNWPSNPIVNGNPLAVATSGGGNPITGTAEDITYYAVNVSGNTFNVALTPGGSAISTSDTGGTGVSITLLASLDIGSGAIPIRSYQAQSPTQAVQMPAATLNSGAVQLWGTATYDAALNCWMLAGATNGKQNQGLMNSVPIEASFALCKQLGMHPFWSIPPLALDPATDFVTGLAAYCQSNNPGWMIPRFEPGNEVWNTATPITFYALGKSFAYWGSRDSNSWYGKALSIMGQGLASVYGLGNLGTTYEVLCGVQTDVGLAPSGFNPRLGSNLWVTQNQPSQSGYAISAGAGWTSAVLCATYVTPPMWETFAELVNMLNYYITYGGNPATSGGMQCLNNYVDTLSGSSTSFNSNAYAALRYAGWKSWGAGYGVNKLFAYEGGYSPDLATQTGVDANSPITGASNAYPCILTLATTNVNQNSTPNTVSGNAAVVGTMLLVTSVNGMTQLNCASSIGGAGNLAFTAGSAAIARTNTFIANQGIMFKFGSTLPPNLQADTPYWISATGLSSTGFQISSTKGGTPIVAGGAGTYTNSGWSSGWIVTAVNGNSVSIDVDSTAFGSWTSGGTANYYESQNMINSFRVATLQYASDLPALLLNNYNNFTAAGGSFPSQYQVAGGRNAWACLQPNIWSPPSQEYGMIQAYNGH